MTGDPANVQLNLLGVPMLLVDGARAAPRTQKALALLAYLAVERRAINRAQLVALFWPDADESRGRGMLRNTLAYLKDALGAHADAVLRADRDVIGLHDGALALDLDLAQVISNDPASIEPALGHHRGEFMQGVAFDDAAELERWLAAQRAHWHGAQSALFARLSELYLDRGDSAAARAICLRWTEHDALNESAQLRLMQALVALGDRAGALQTYDAWVRVCADELGTQPARAMTELAARVRQGEMPTMPTQPKPARNMPARASLPMVGRAVELAQLAREFDDTRSSGARAVLVEGESGMGKSRLIEEFMAWASARGADILALRTFETSGQTPYGALIATLRARIERENAPDDLLPDVWLAELARLLPELRERYPDLPRASDDPVTAQTRLNESLTQLCLALAARAPLVLVVDDTQWSDDATLGLIAYLAGRAAQTSAPILMVLIARSGEAYSSVERLRQDVARSGRLARVSLGPLTATDAAALARAQADATGAPVPAADVGQRLLDETGGQPFFLVELLRNRASNAADAGPIMLPASVRDVLLARMAQLRQPAQLLLSASAVLGGAFEFAQLCAVASLDADGNDATFALEEALAAHVLREAGRQGAIERYALAHEQLRDVVYTELGAQRRRLLHRRALAALSDSAPAAELARHALGADQPERAFALTLQAGDQAMRLFAVRDALRLYQGAIDIARETALPNDSADIALTLQKLGRAHELDNDLGAAQAAYKASVADAAERGDARAESLALNRLATAVAQDRLNIPRALALLERASQAARAVGDEAAIVETEWNRALLNVYQSNSAVALEHAQAVLAIAKRGDDSALLARVHNIMGTAQNALGQVTEARAHLREALRLFEQIGDRALQSDTLSLLTNSELLLGDSAAALSAAQRAYDMSERDGNRWGQAQSAMHMVMARIDSGDVAGAVELAERVITLAQTTNFPLMKFFAQIALGNAYRAAGRPTDALDAHQGAVTFHTAELAGAFAGTLHSALCADYAALGDWVNAHAQAGLAGAPDRGPGAFYPVLTRDIEIEAFTRAGDAAQAQRALDTLTRMAVEMPRLQPVLERARSAVS
jgi:DNA-binding SARP family transcriptional activator/predicted ATPase